jgi:hypothetical protein
MKKSAKEKWAQDLYDFSSSQTDSISVPDSALIKLKKTLFPSPWVVFGKILGLHMIVGFLSLGICNQFGLNPFQTDQSLTAWFMKMAGHHGCMVLCGFFFVTTTYLLSNTFLTLEELESIKRHEWVQTGVLGLASIASFYFFGAELIGSFVLFWFVGLAAGGYISIEASYRLRRSLI